MRALESKSKDELLDIVKKAINDHPYLIDELKIRIEGVMPNRIGANIDGTIGKIRRIASDDEYYSPDALVLKLENIRDTAESLEHEGHYTEASVIYLELIDAGLQILGIFPITKRSARKRAILCPNVSGFLTIAHRKSAG